MLGLFGAPVAAVIYGAAEASMMAGRGEVAGIGEWLSAFGHWTGVVLGQVAVGAVVATVLGGLAGWMLSNRR